MTQQENVLDLHDLWIRDESAKLKLSKAMYPQLWESYKIKEESLIWFPLWGYNKFGQSRILKKIYVKDYSHPAFTLISPMENAEICDYEELLQIYQFLAESCASKMPATEALPYIRSRN